MKKRLWPPKSNVTGSVNTGTVSRTSFGVTGWPAAGGGLGKALGEQAAVEVGRALGPEPTQDAGQFQLLELIALVRQGAGVVPENARHLRVGGDPPGRRGQVAGEGAADRVAETGQGLRRAQKLFPAHQTVACMKRRHGARALRDHPVLSAGPGQELQRLGRAVAAVEDHADPAAAQAHARRVCDGHGEVHGRGGVGGVSPDAQDVAAQHGGPRLVGDHDAGETLDQAERGGFLVRGPGAAGQRREREGKS